MIHLGRRHAGQPGDGLERLGRDRHRVIGHKIAGPLWGQLCGNLLRPCLENWLPVILYRAGAQRRKQDLALVQMRRAILAHHVLPHQPGHQTLGLEGRENLGSFLLNMYVITPGDQRRAQLRDKGDWRLGPHPRQRGIGISGKGGGVDFGHGCIGHGAKRRPAICNCLGSDARGPALSASPAIARTGPFAAVRQAQLSGVNVNPLPSRTT